MESAIGAASWLVGKVLNKLSDDLVAAYVASSELGLNSEQIQTKLKYMQGLLHASQERDASSNPGLQSLLEDLSKKADEAENVLDELHYFMIQDQLNDTQEATPELGDGLRGHVLHGRHAARHTIGNWLPCFSCSHTQDDDCAAPTVITNTSQLDSGTGKLTFDRVAMSNRIKFVIESIHNLCDPISDLVNKIPNNSTVATVKRPTTGSMVAQDKFYGRRVIFDQTVNALTDDTYHTETLSVMPFVGPGGIGKTTFAQHLYNDERIEGHFTVRVWICVSTDFDVIKLTRQILSCIQATENEANNGITETSNLDQLQKSIAEKLKSKRFLIVLDDIWKCNNEGEWKNLLAPFTKGAMKGSMVLVTTRFPAISHMVTTTDPVELHGLEPNDFFTFFEACIFDHRKPENYEDDLSDVARDIANKLKGSPLAANTVGRMLKKNLSREYWLGVLEKNEWQNTKNDDDIMPSLKISYHYLPYRLKKCFSSCALFPEDYEFGDLEITDFWIASGIIDSRCQNNNNYLEELVDNGFLMEVGGRFGQFYMMHDLLHELSRNVSAQECANISSLSFTANSIPHSIRHLSITIEDIYDENFVEEMVKLKGMIDIENLRTLMIFGYHDARITNVFKDTFEYIKSLRVLFIDMNTQGSLPTNFSNLIHLQYLRISSPLYLEITLPSTLSRFYQLKFLDLDDWHGSINLPRDFSSLVNLAHIYYSKELLSNIPKIGKMRCLRELKKFYVKKESLGFDLEELGELNQLGGELSIYNLETVASKEEAKGAKLKNKRNIKDLRLVWGIEHLTVDDDVLDGLQPHPNLRFLGIINPCVAAGPSWLCSESSTKQLESLHLEGVSWDNLPPFEKLPYLNELSLKNVGMSVFGPGFAGITERSFIHLKTIWFEDMPELVEWVGEPNSHLFASLEIIKCKNCPFLCSFPFIDYSVHFTKLSTLDIDNCPKLPKFPPMPHTSTLTSMTLRNNGSTLSYNGNCLDIDGYNGALVFDNMDTVQFLSIRNVGMCVFGPGFGGVTERSFMNLKTILFENMPELEEWVGDPNSRLFANLEIIKCKNCPFLCLFPFLEYSVRFTKIYTLDIDNCPNLPQFPPMPHTSTLTSMTLRSNGSTLSYDGYELDIDGYNGALVFQNMDRVQSMEISNVSHISYCHKMFSQWPMGEVGGSQTNKPFPPSLTSLRFFGDAGMKSMALLSNLTCLTHLCLVSCTKLTMDRFNPLIMVNLKVLTIFNSEYYGNENISIAGHLLSEVSRSKLMHAGSFQLEKVELDNISAILVAPICSHLARTLHDFVREIRNLYFQGPKATIYSTCTGDKYAGNPSYNGETIQVYMDT